MSNEEDSEMVFRAKMHFFASEVWTLEDQAEKLQLQVLVLPEKDNSFQNYKSNDNDSEHNALQGVLPK